MRLPLAILAFLLAATLLPAQSPQPLKPTDFTPLISLPWKKPAATLETTLDAIFREPDPAIRYPVLALYLRALPAADLGRAFDQCIALEDTHTPDALVYFFLEIWARRDPQACWKRVQELFKVVGIEQDWRAYSDWNEKIVVQDANAIKGSRFWLKSSSLKSFAVGVDESWLAKKDRLAILKQFADKWFAAFGTWPGVMHEADGFPWRYPTDQPGLTEAFAMPVEKCPTFAVYQNVGGGSFRTTIQPGYKAAFEIAQRRWLASNPAAAPEILQKALTAEYQNPVDRLDPCAPQTGLLVIWSRLDSNGMFQWVESLDLKNDADLGMATQAKGLLMATVTPVIRDRWVAEMRAISPEDESWLLAEWAAWDPEKGFPAAIEINKRDIRTGAIDPTNFDTIDNAAQSATNRFRVINSHRFGCETVAATDIGALPAQAKSVFLEQWSVILDFWAESDISAVAEYGVRFLGVADPDSRAKWLRYFAGERMNPTDEIIRRTVAALRIWAVTNPAVMKSWIATLNDPDLEKSLNWLLAHPLGGDLSLPGKDKPQQKPTPKSSKKSK